MRTIAVNAQQRATGRILWLAAAFAAGACGDSVDDPPSQGTSGSTGVTSQATATSAGEGTTALDSSGDEPSTSGGVASGWATVLDVDAKVGAFYSVWGPSPDFLYSVASQPLDGGLSAGGLFLWDGAAWTAQELEADTPGLNWVFGLDDRRFLVGELGAILVRDGDEGPWERMSCGTILPLWGVWGAAVDDAWAVGGDGFNRDPVACHYDGETWTLVELPEPSFESHALYKVWGTAADNVWAVGDEGLIMHFGGEVAGWTEVPSGAEGDLISIWGTGPDEILAVGGRSGGILSRYDGTQWETQTAPRFLGLNGVWMAADGTATVVGPQGGIGVVAPGELSIVPEDSGTLLSLHGIIGFAEGQRWAVGGSLEMPPPHVGTVLFHDAE